MIKYLIIFLTIFQFNNLFAKNNVLLFVESALKNNPKINAERENLKAVKENQNISRSEFLQSLTISGSQTSTETTEIINQSGTRSGDTKRNTETKKISVDQKLFQGFQGYNNLKKSILEFEKAKNEYKQVEQDTILKSVSSVLVTSWTKLTLLIVASFPISTTAFVTLLVTSTAAVAPLEVTSAAALVLSAKVYPNNWAIFLNTGLKKSAAASV